MTAHHSQELFTVASAAQILGLSQSTIRRWANNDLIRTLKVGRARMVPASELRRLVEQGLAFPVSDGGQS